MKEILISLDGSEPGRLSGPGPFRIGRDDEASFHIASRLVSRNHLLIESVNNEWRITDTSSNGTFDATGHRISQVQLNAPLVLNLGAPSGPRLDMELVSGDLAWEDDVEGTTRRRSIQDPNPISVDFIDAPEPVFPYPKPLEETRATAVKATNLQISTGDGTVLVEDVSMSIEHGTLTAVLGPTGAGKSTLLNTIAGNRRQSSGILEVAGVDLYQNITELQLEIGFVPQDDIVHTQLTIEQALTYGAELRLPVGTPRTEIEASVARVCDELGLTEHRQKRIAKLSGGQRKRASVALELLTEPSLLLLDEPTSGLDPGYEASLMQLFRRLVDSGRTIVVVTHSMSSLELCDQVIFLGTGGWIGYAGPPDEALPTLGASDYPTAFRQLERANPHPVVARLNSPPEEPEPQSTEINYPTSFEAQLATLLKRNLSLLISDPRGLLVLMASALVPAVLLSALVGNGTLDVTGGSSTGAARTLLGGVIIAAGVIGAANGLREIVKDMPIYRRERAAGLRRGAYLLAKIGVLSGVTIAQTGMLVFIATFLASPSDGNILPARLELLAAGAMTALASLLLGLFISAFVSSSEKALALIPVVFVAFWLFSGTVSDLAGKPVLSQIAYASPSNWGTAAAASSADLPSLEGCSPMATSDYETSAVPAGGRECDARWGHNIGQWIFDLFAVAVIGALLFLGTDWALARQETIVSLRKEHIIGRLWRGIRAKFVKE